jgi:hypothetical protein
MLDLFTSVGARSFVVTKTELEWPGHKAVKWGRTYFPAQLREKLPAMVRTAASRQPHHLPDGRTLMAGENLIIRPIGHCGDGTEAVTFVQLDDLRAEQLDHVRAASFLIIATSPGNHQAWIAVSGVEKSDSKDFVRRVRKAVGDADMSASGATRVAGSVNYKVKYGPDYPTVSIVYGIPGRVMTPEQLANMGLLAAPEPVRAAPLRVSARSGGSWPDYERCVQGAPLNRDGSGPDISKADFFFGMLSAQRGNGIEEIAARLMELSPKAKENGERYARVTAENATAASDRGRQRNRA